MLFQSRTADLVVQLCLVELDHGCPVLDSIHPVAWLCWQQHPPPRSRSEPAQLSLDVLQANREPVSTMHEVVVLDTRFYENTIRSANDGRPLHV